MKATKSSYFEAAERFEYMLDDEVKSCFPMRLEKLREMIGVTQDEFAQRIGVSRQSISLYEQGKRVPDICILNRIIEVTGCSPYYLLGSQETMVDELFVLQTETNLSDDACSKLLTLCRRARKPMELLLTSDDFHRFIEYIGFACEGGTICYSKAVDDPRRKDAYFRFKAHCLVDNLISLAESKAAQMNCIYSDDILDNGAFSHINLEFAIDEYKSDPQGILEERLEAVSNTFSQCDKKNAEKIDAEPDRDNEQRISDILNDKFENFKAKLLKYGPYSEKKLRR